jgi:hypothetical protein
MLRTEPNGRRRLSSIIAFEVNRIAMQPSALQENAAEGTFEFDGIFVGSINDFR